MDEFRDTLDDATDGEPPSDTARHPVAWILAFFAAAVVALAVIQYFWRPANPGTSGDGIGRALPDLQLQPLTGDGQPVSLKDLSGKVTLLDFWGTWCPPCRAEFPHIAAIANEHRDRPDFQLLAVSCGDTGDDNSATLRPDTDAFLKNNKLNVPTYWDPQGHTRQQVEKIAGFEGYPTTLVIDRQGVIRGRWVGYEWGTERQIASLVAKLLSEPPKESRAN